jgi:hypothetical protein
MNLEFQLSILFEELEKGCFDTLDRIPPYNDLWSLFQTSKRSPTTPMLIKFHRKLIQELIRHRKFYSLEIQEIDYHDTLFEPHWLLVLLESIRSEIHEMVTISTQRLELYNGQNGYDKYSVERIIKTLIVDCEPNDVILFFNYCKSMGRETYITFRGQLLKEIRIYDEDSLPITPKEFIDRFNDKWKQDIISLEYVFNMFREEQEYELTFMEVFQQLNEKLRERKIVSHAEYVIAEMVLEDKVLKDILTHIIQPYL